MDGAKKTVEFLAQGFLKNSLLYVFKNRDLHALFDRQFHKLGVSVESNAVSIYLDCKLIERQVTAERFGMNVSGRTFITTRVEDGRPVDVSCGRRFSSLAKSEYECKVFVFVKAPLNYGGNHL